MLDAVSSSEAACSSVRCDRSWLPAAIWCVAVAIESAETLIVPIVCVSCACMRFIENSRLERSSGAVFTTAVRSLSAIRLAISAA